MKRMLKKILDWLQREGLSIELFFSKKHKYTESELRLFEEKHHITLPKDYRNYLIQKGIGIRINGLEEWCQPDNENDFPADFLSRDFPHTEAWNDKSLFKKEKSWDSPYFDRNLACGALRIVNTGCEGYHLLIVSGPERGNMWHDDRACSGWGIYPLRTWGRNRVTFAEFIGIRWITCKPPRKK